MRSEGRKVVERVVRVGVIRVGLGGGRIEEDLMSYIGNEPSQHPH